MPEVFFAISWPDGTREHCYSPSRVIREHFTAGAAYDLADFLARSRVALCLASDRVQAKYGMPCSRAMGQLARLEQHAARFADAPDARVTVETFTE
jgi:uncharacterized repeat protein (TIGR04042 family)